MTKQQVNKKQGLCDETLQGSCSSGAKQAEAGREATANSTSINGTPLPPTMTSSDICMLLMHACI